MNAKLKIHRINKRRFQVRDGDKVIRECTSLKEAMNAIIYEDLIALDNLNDFMKIDEVDEVDLWNS